MFLKHFSDALLVLFSEQCQFAALVVLELLDDRFLLVARGGGQQLGLEGLVLARLYLDRFAKLLADENLLLFETLGLLLELNGVLLAQLSLGTLRVLVLIRQLRLMLAAELLLTQHVHSSLLAVLELLREFVVAEEHGVRRLQLRLPLVELFAEQLALQPVVREQFGTSQPPYFQLEVVLLTLRQSLLLACFYRFQRILVVPVKSIKSI